MNAPYCVVYVAAPDKKTAAKISGELVGQKLAACVSQVPGVSSEYWWNGKREKSDELLLIVKTRRSLLPEIVQCVKEHHPDKVPEVIALPAVGGSQAYLDWLGANTNFSRSAPEKIGTPPKP